MATRSDIFTAYNVARKLSRKGLIDAGRLNRALGIALSKDRDHLQRYHTTLTDCRCPDHAKAGHTCKGQLAISLLIAAEPMPTNVTPIRQWDADDLARAGIWEA